MKLFALLLLLTSCGKIELNDDPTPAASSSQYATAEFYACDKVWHGLGVCLIESGTQFSFKVQTYHKGTISYVFDNDPSIHSETYKNNEKIKIDVPYDTRVVRFSVIPEIDNVTKSTTPFVGYLYVREKKRETDVVIRKAPEGSKINAYVSVGSIPKVNAFLFGCGLDWAGFLEAKNGHVMFTHPKLPAAQPPCIMTGGIKAEGIARDFIWMVQPHLKDFLPLPIPDVKVANEKITISADPTTSIVGLDDKSYFETKVSQPFNVNKSHVVRALTIKGRSSLGVYTPGEGFTWFQ